MLALGRVIVVTIVTPKCFLAKLPTMTKSHKEIKKDKMRVILLSGPG